MGKNKNLIIGALVIAGVGLLYYYFKNQNSAKLEANKQPTQTADADEIVEILKTT
jgi:hypothetical protein